MSKQPLVTIKHRDSATYYFYFNTEAMDIITVREVVVQLTMDYILIRKPTIDDNKRFHINKNKNSTNTGQMTLSNIFIDISGEYIVYRENEDVFKLIRLENE